MKKVVTLLLATLLICAVVLTGCAPQEKYEIALVTDVGNIDDQSFNQSSWEGTKAFAEDNNKTYAYYRPAEDSTNARVDSINAAIDKGAKVIVCPGFLFEETIYTVQEQHPDVQFLLLDGEPHDADYNYKTESNVHCILYREEQAGYYAGYAAVKDGYTQLGFLGGMDVPAVIRYGFGFVQGADAAAKEMGITDQVSIKYWYSQVFAPSDDIKTKMSGWYTSGTEVVFACGGGIYLSAVAAAEASEGGKVIGVDVDQASQSPLIITSAMKNLKNSVVLALTDLYENGGKWSADYAGTTVVLGTAEDCVGLPTAEDSWRLETFTVEEYQAVYDQVKSGAIVVSNETENPPAVEIAVDYQK